MDGMSHHSCALRYFAGHEKWKDWDYIVFLFCHDLRWEFVEKTPQQPSIISGICAGSQFTIHNSRFSFVRIMFLLW